MGLASRGLARLDYLFKPKSVAIVGVSSNPQALANRNFLGSLLKLGYKGRIYPVNPRLHEVMGLKVYSCLGDISEPVDYAICAIPAAQTPAFMEECVAARTRVVSFYTAGFSETGEVEGCRLENTVAEIAARGGVRILGPNCLGVHCAESGVSFESTSLPEPGRAAFLFQSGGNARDLIIVAAERGIAFAKGVSYGNACDFNESDFLEHFAADPGIELIAAYVEGFKEPERFRRLFVEACMTKPVIVLKGGRTVAGRRAVTSHTGVLAGNAELWESLCRQAGAIQADSLEDMVDMISAFTHMGVPRGPNVALVGVGGGASVQSADDCEIEGLIVPAFDAGTRQELRRFTPQAGISLGNPVDTSADVYWDPSLFGRTVAVAAGCEAVDVVFVVLGLIYGAKHGAKALEGQVRAIVEAGQNSGKPLAIVFRTGAVQEADIVACHLARYCIDAGVPVFRSVRQAARVTVKLMEHHARTRHQDIGI